ncbi:RecX family transcriptional regulator [Methylobacterium planeticum]|uniref:Regulatory protein RecX n=1 Tax=Methylobacterium planeticum TaxID=2615211 RepID=A0A6N6MTW9_9HYPH|nr:RecX family transcriptional regulator [Methylobacterium planeticum]KAB1072157.1 regulatory protein RecX [Methylobacterium planeticum]
MSVRNVAERPGRGPDVAEARPTPPITAAWLERAALHYLERYSASTEMLRRTLRRRVEKRARARGEAAEAFGPMIEAVVARAVRGGLVDDARFTAARLATLRRRGASARGAAAKLAAKGVSREAIATAMEAEREAAEREAAPAGEAEAVEAQAARAYARRRRLGPFRRPGTRAAHRDRDLAAMARAGFHYGLARATIEAEAEAEDEVGDGGEDGAGTGGI